MVWQKAWRVGVLILSFFFFWSIGFSVTSSLEGNRNKQQAWKLMLGSGLATASFVKQHPEQVDYFLRQMAMLTPASVVFIDARGQRLSYGEQATSLSDEIDQQTLKVVSKGGTIKSFRQANLFRPGQATIGHPMDVNGRMAALFIRTETPAQFNHYGQQFLALVIGGALQLLALFIYFRLRPKTHQQFLQIMINGLHRITKGDFKVNLITDPKRIGPYEQMATSINQMAGELGQLERMRQEFIANVSHEIQSPLTSISGFSSELLQNTELSNEERIEILRIIEMESKRVSKLSNNLLKLTSLESDHYPLEMKRYRLDSQLRDVILSCEPQWIAKKFEMDVKLANVSVLADEDTLNQVWFNLLNNSIKFTPEGGTIEIRLELRNDHAVIIIRDTGCGIDEEDIPFVFERFFKADKSRNRSISGSGLGLSIVNKIIDMHQGTITVHSKIDEGTAFIVKLPLST